MLLFIIKTAKGSKAANLVVTGCAVKPCHPYPALAVSGQGPPSRPSRRASGVGRWHPLANQGGQGGQNFAPIGRLAFVSCPGTIPTNGASPLCGVGGPCSNVQAITASGFMLGHTPHFWDFLTTGERTGQLVRAATVRERAQLLPHRSLTVAARTADLLRTVRSVYAVVSGFEKVPHT